MDLPLLQRIIETPGVSGFETEIRDIIKSECEPFTDRISTDAMGNLMVSMGSGKVRAMIAAHMDEIGLISTYVDDQGFIRFHTLGGFDLKTLFTQRVRVLGKETLPGVIGAKPTHVLKPEEKKKAPEIDDLFIDVGLPAEKVKALVPTGTPIVRDRDCIKMGDFVTGKSLDNRLSVYTLIEVLKRVQLPDEVSLHAVFTVQEEVGLRGVRVAAEKIKPHIGLAMDITVANDIPGVPAQKKITEAGKGPAIKIMDGSVISSPGLVSFMEEIAKKESIPVQRELLTSGGTDTPAMQYLTGIGAYTGCISIPTRYIHSTVEAASITDIEQTVTLTTSVLSALDAFPLYQNDTPIND
ncbi:M42 family metallopeptidase [Balneolaceae bacterium ANBcel3]|nr:M42 family metallopeptidase [Balneolaceae bacterium ANBcel3]